MLPVFKTVRRGRQPYKNTWEKTKGKLLKVHNETFCSGIIRNTGKIWGDLKVRENHSSDWCLTRYITMPLRKSHIFTYAYESLVFEVCRYLSNNHIKSLGKLCKWKPKNIRYNASLNWACILSGDSEIPALSYLQIDMKN